MNHKLSYISPTLKLKRLLYFGMLVPPEVGHERYYWRDALTAEQTIRDVIKRHPEAERVRCGWCGKYTFAYEIKRAVQEPDTHLGSSTICLFCGRPVEEWYQNWSYRAEFSDGCELTQYSDGRMGGGGPSHAPHLAFKPSDFPILEWGEPLLDCEDFRFYGFKGSHPSDAYWESQEQTRKWAEEWRVKEKEGTLWTTKWYAIRRTNKKTKESFDANFQYSFQGKEPSTAVVMNAFYKHVYENENTAEWDYEFEGDGGLPLEWVK